MAEYHDSATLTLFDTPPPDVPETGTPGTVYAKGNVEHGHLLIASELGDWVFTYTGSTTVRCHHPGAVSGIDLTADDLHVLADYCRGMAQRIDIKAVLF